MINYFKTIKINIDKTFYIYKHIIKYKNYKGSDILYLCPARIFFNNIQPYNNSFRNMNTQKCIKLSKLDLNNKIRMLWEQHVAWTRMLITSIVFDLPDTDLITNRLLQNPIHFEKALRPFYGDNISSQFSNLLRNHLIIAAQLVKSAKAGDSKGAANAEKEWYDNADEIAAFLSSINPYWYQNQWRDMLHKHLELTKSEAVHMLNKDYASSISEYDEIERQALEMADVMTKGIIKQFARS